MYVSSYNMNIKYIYIIYKVQRHGGFAFARYDGLVFIITLIERLLQANNAQPSLVNSFSSEKDKYYEYISYISFNSGRNVNIKVTYF